MMPMENTCKQLGLTLSCGLVFVPKERSKGGGIPNTPSRCVHLLVGVETNGPAPSKKLSKVLFALPRWLQRLTKVQGDWLKSPGIRVPQPSGEIRGFIAQLAAVSVKFLTLPWNFLFSLVKNGVYWWHVFHFCSC